MSSLYLEYPSQSLELAIPAGNSTEANFTAKAPTTTRLKEQGNPWRIAGSAGVVKRQLIVLPFGTAANNATMKMRVWGWDEYPKSNRAYFPMLLAELDVTLGNIAGIEAICGANAFMADTLALGTGINADFVDVNASTSDEAAFARIDTQGCKWIEFDFDRNGSAASCNALWKTL